MSKFCKVFLVAFFISVVQAWDSEDFEIFDLVEEVGQSFYDTLEIPENADAGTIKKAFRKLSLALHPDKNDAPDANVKFRQLVAIYEVLRYPSKRAKYDDVLINGLPDWKEAVYYYRKVRKMGLTEMSIILFIIISIGQYLVAWAAYFEKKYNMEELVSIRSKKLLKKQKKGKSLENVTIQVLGNVAPLEKPTVLCTLPFQICRFSWFLVMDFPSLSYKWVERVIEERRLAKELAEEEESSEEEVILVRERGPRRRKAFTAPELKEVGKKPGEEQASPETEHKTQEEDNRFVSGGLWTDDDFGDLIRLMKKYPPGTQERWEKIGQVMRRPTHEVAHMAHKMKDDGFKPMIKQEEDYNDVRTEESKKAKTKGGKLANIDVTLDTPWSQAQQKAFEQALATYPKGTVGDRWEKIANSVPDKTKEECMLRYKSIVDIIKKKKDKPELNEDK